LTLADGWISDVNEILEHYSRIREADRLFAGHGELERVRTQEIIQRYLMSPPASILDVGGGPGVYASWLLGLGYSVHLIDPVPLHVEQAKQRMAAAGGEGSADMGDARELPFANASQDGVLMLGPLYHLTERTDRIRALAEARRVLRGSGFLIAAAISRFASLLDGFSRNLISDPLFRAILGRDLQDGQHRNFTADRTYFTTAFFHRPEDLADEVTEAGFRVERLLGVEGPFWCLAGFERLWPDAATRSYMLETLRRIEDDTSLMGASAHLLVVARPTEEHRTSATPIEQRG
jgi:ubiquinone/menaquinone biosynthesis C-methylase UbiE